MEVEFISQGKVVYTGHITEKIHLNLNTFSIPISQYSERDSNENISLPPSDFLQKKTERKELEDSFDASNNNISNINNINPQIIKKKKYYNDYDESEEDIEEEESEEYEESENISEDNIDSENYDMNNSSDNININKNSD